jgi:hypothetical protein
MVACAEFERVAFDLVAVPENVVRLVGQLSRRLEHHLWLRC